MTVVRRAGARSQRGFTLLELLITLSITTIGLIGLLSLHLSIARGNDGASRAAEAQQITAQALEAMRGPRILADANNQNLAAFLVNDPNALPPIVAPVLNVPGRGNMTYSVARTVVAVPGAPNLWRLRVVTTWAEDGAAIGASAGQFDHSIALEIIRTLQESL